MNSYLKVMFHFVLNKMLIKKYKPFTGKTPTYRINITSPKVKVNDNFCLNATFFLQNLGRENRSHLSIAMF